MATNIDKMEIHIFGRSIKIGLNCVQGGMNENLKSKVRLSKQADFSISGGQIFY